MQTLLIVGRQEYARRIDIGMFLAADPVVDGHLAYLLSRLSQDIHSVEGEGAMLTGLIASCVLYHGDSLRSFRLQAGSFVAFFVCVVFAPLIMFTAQMARERRKGLAEYGLLAQRYPGEVDCRIRQQLRGTSREW
jgi:hypothetical protein